MSVEVHRTNDGAFVVADHGGWLPGVYPSEAMARAAASCDYDTLAKWWLGVRHQAEEAMRERIEVAFKKAMSDLPHVPSDIAFPMILLEGLTAIRSIDTRGE